MVKRCNKCGQEKPVDEFHKNSRGTYGVRATCKECKNAQDRRQRTENAEAVREHARNWYWENHEAQLQARRKRNTRGTGLPKAPGEDKKNHKRHKREHTEQRRAGKAVNGAVSKGTLPRIDSMLCAVCGSRAEHYHHWSYLKEHRLSVIPVCVPCHKRIHSDRIVIDDPLRLAVPREKMRIPADPISAGYYLAKRVDMDWMLTCFDVYAKSLM